MADSEWIDVRERMPREKDADSTGRVMVWHVLNGVMMTGWHRVSENRFITHWKPSPEGPEGAADPDTRAIYGRVPTTLL